MVITLHYIFIATQGPQTAFHGFMSGEATKAKAKAETESWLHKIQAMLYNVGMKLIIIYKFIARINIYLQQKVITESWDICNSRV